jgi:dihydroorotase-like cyclic amidohydrolase
LQRDEVWIRGGTVVTAYGMKEADIWIQNGIIRRVAKDTLQKRRAEDAERHVEVIDAKGMYLLPGFLALPDIPLVRLHEVREYLHAVRKLVRYGYTFVLDTLYLEDWMDDAQVLYQQAPHFNSPVDYSVQIAMEPDSFCANRVRSLIQQGFRLFQVVLWKAGLLEQVNWEELESLVTRYRLSAHLDIPANARLSAEERQDALQLWLQSCRRNKVRTCVSWMDPIEQAQVDSFYHLVRVAGEKSGRTLEYLAKQWYGSLPVLATLTDVAVNTDKKRWDPEELLCLLVRVASTNIAKAIGLYPRKGGLSPGADADIVFLKKDDWLTKFSLSTILKFSEIFLPTSVMSNGRWIYHEGSFTSTIGMGRCLLDAKPYNYVI